MRPRVSVVMPTYNQAELLPRALEGLDSQTFRQFEVIVVDDGSVDDTPFLVDKWAERHAVFGDLPVRVIHQPNAKTAAAINAGISMARGDWWTWVSSDNQQYPNWLERLLAVVDAPEARDVGAIFSDYDWRFPDGRVVPSQVDFDRAGYQLGQLVTTLNCFFGPSFLVRKQVWRAAGPQQGLVNHDYDHWLRIEEVCANSDLRIVYLPERLCLYDGHLKRATVTRPHEADAAHWQQAALQRRREGRGVLLREVKP